MTRIDFRPFLVLGLALTILVYVGCGKTVETPQPRTVTGKNGPISEAPVIKVPDSSKVFADWKDPVGALLISGQQNNYLEPCGCTQGQLGGIGRRYDLIQKTEARGIPLARIDLGSLVKNPAAARGGIEDSKIRFGVALKALEAMEYDALTLSADDLKLGVGEILGIYLNLKDKPKVLSGNVIPDEAFKEVIRQTVITKVGEISIGVTSVLSPQAYAELLDTDKLLLNVKAPEEVLPGIIAELEKTTKYQVLMVQGPEEMAKDLAAKFPQFDIVVATDKVDDPEDKPSLLNGGKTRLIHVGMKGKYVGVFGFFDDADPAQQIRYQRVRLDEARYKNAEPMRKLVDEDMQAQFKALGIVSNFQRRPNSEGPSDAKYVGADACKDCHPATYARWSTSGHAKSYEGLLKPGRNREFDADCVACHTTGFPYTSGWVSAEVTPYLKGNQCENCHGPSSKHVEQPDNKEFLAKMHRTAELADKQGLCLRCHDGDNSPKFNFATYYGKIAHKGMDDYKDPKVHQGRPIPPAVAAQSK